MPSKFFNFYLSTGFTTNNFIAFYPSSNPRSKLDSYHNYYKEKIGGSVFLNFGLVLRFGKTRSSYYNSQMNNAMDLNNGVDGNDTAVNPGNGNIPVPSEKMKKIKTDDVLDLLETQDLY
jgi:hypothetical protein